jgi:hypothetical protein
MEIVDNLVVGKPDVKQSASSHTRGVREGNEGSSFLREPGFKPRGPLLAQATPRRSTGINAAARAPIDPRMPNLTPA